jgi:acylphosphatase
MIIGKHCLVSGRVQGVFYRASAQQQARRLNIVGHAKNLSDGRVEVIAIGAAPQVEEFIRWLWQGSPASHVTQVDVAPVALSELGELPYQFDTR